MLRFAQAPEAVFQSIQDGLSYAIDFISDMRSESDTGGLYPGKISSISFPPRARHFPHPEELALKVDKIEDPLLYTVTTPLRYFGPRSKVYPDFEYYEKSG